MKRTARRWIPLLVAMALCCAGWSALAEDGATLSANVDEIVVSVGKVASFKLTITPGAARKAGVSYSVSDEAVATVDSRGRVKGVGEGQCQLTVQSKADEAVRLTLPVSVVIPVKKMTATAGQSTLFVGETTQITVAYAPENATLQKAVYTSSSEKIATVDANGVVTGVSKGNVTISLRSADGYAKAAVRMTVQQQPESIELTASNGEPIIGRPITVKATVLPKNANNRKVAWASLNEDIATVDRNGRVTAHAPGGVVITATSQADPSVSASIRLSSVRLAKTVDFDTKRYTVTLGESAPLHWTVGPEDVSDKSVSFKSGNAKIVSVDSAGVVTALAPGKATITVTTEDGSRRRAKTTVYVHVPVTGVHFARNDIRIGANASGTFTATIEPKRASNTNMTWTVDDPSVATVSGSTNRVRVHGVRWGRCRLTGVTEDGGFTCSVYVDVGSLRHAVTVRSVDIRDGKPYLVLTNRSNMNITGVSFKMTGTDENGDPVTMSTRNGETLYGEYTDGLAPGESTRHGRFTFFNHTNYPDLQTLSVAVIGWNTDTGYYNSDGALCYDYSIAESKLDWSTYQSDLYLWTQQNKPAQ